MPQKILIVLTLLAGLINGIVYAEEKTGGSIYVNVPNESLRLTPDGKKAGTFYYGTQLKEIERRGDWVRVRAEGWVPVKSVSNEEPKEVHDKNWLEIKSWKWANEESSRRISIEGFIVNNSVDTFNEVNMFITAKDANGNLLGIAVADVKPKEMPPGIISVFKAYISNALCPTRTIDITYRFDIR
ncbi:MAG: hypothetical protein HZB61_00895 [Nitrospirae bacterium]|nr:hypothetical protein [Nitrospirota bacterium]